jgi:hypothetical protein
MSVLLHKLRTLAGFNQQQLLWFVPLYVLSGLMRLALLALPFRRIAPWLGQHHANMTMTLLLTEEQENLSRRMGTVIRTLSKYTPWESKCLVQAMLARIVLGYYGIPHVIYLGVNQSGPQENPMNAHAWVSAGRCFVTGGNSFQQFGVVSSFVNGEGIAQCLE